MSVAGAVLVPLALGYLGATVLFQFPPLSRRFALLDRLGALPRWKFFTQAGATLDVGLKMRARRSDGSLGDWTAVSTFPPRRPWHFLWQPEQYRGGFCWEAIATLEARVKAGRAASLDNSLAYLMILNRCRQEGALLDSAQAVQFALAPRRAGGDERAFLFMSGFHDP